jgi:hypothetical protein
MPETMTIDELSVAVEKIQLELVAARRVMLQFRRLLAYTLYTQSSSGFNYVPAIDTKYLNKAGNLVSERFHSPHTVKGKTFVELQTGSIRSNDL